MTKQFLAQREGDILTTENGFVYAWAAGSATGNCICTVEFLKANRRKFKQAGWKFERALSDKQPKHRERAIPHE